MPGSAAGGGPLAASLIGHALLVAAVAWAGFSDGPAAAPAPGVVPVSVPAPTAGSRRLSIETPAQAEEGTALAPALSIPLDSADPRYRPYLSVVKRRIWERWRAPAIAGGRTARGALVVEFTLSRSGGLSSSGVREPSGVPALDRAALDAVARAVPFQPLPVSIVGDSLRVCARFVYE